MATILPTLDKHKLSQLRSAAEATVYEKCATLANTFVVIFSFPWIRATPYGSPRDGETDFLIVHPTKGILSIEVKGGGVSFDPMTGDWLSEDRHGIEHNIKNPFEQARICKYALRDYLRDEVEWSHLGLRPNFGHGVFLPDLTDVSKLVGADRPLDIIGTRPDLQRFSDWIDNLFDYWKGQTDNRQAKELGTIGMDYVSRNFCRSVKVKPLLSTILHDEEQERIRLTNEQCRLLLALKNHEQIAISGGAGTGKTMLAVHRAQELAREGKRVLFLCYNQPLADQLIRATSDADSLHTMTFHQFCGKVIKATQEMTGVDFVADATASIPDGSRFDDWLPLALSEALSASNISYDALIIDEGQDFRDSFWMPIAILADDNPNMTLCIFFDHNQRLYTRCNDFPINGPAFELTRNCRNTDIIHRVAYQFYTGTPTDTSSIHGDEIEFISGPTLATQAKRLHAHVVGLLEKQKVRAVDICIIVPSQSSQNYSSLMTPYPLPHGIRWAVEEFGAANSICIETMMRFKGLESNYLYFWGADQFDRNVDVELLYVTLSRAKSRLCLVGDQKACAALVGAGRASDSV